MNNTINHVPVLVAGGGPVGLATALELSHHGVAVLVVEPRETVSPLRPRAKTTSARTMELFRRWGLSDRIRARAALPVSWSDEAIFTTSLLGREITRFSGCFGLDLTGADIAAEAGQQIPQPVIEEVLREAVDSAPHATLLTGWTVTGLSQTTDQVTARIEHSDGTTRSVCADFVVGADGAWSAVRDSIGARYAGSADERPNFNIVFRAPGLADKVPHGPAVHYWVLHPRRPGVLGRLDLEDMWWCIAQGVTEEHGAADTLGIVRELVGADIEADIVATDPWKAKLLLADHYRAGRVFLAGDAAHLNPPWGGHGFNTGIGDAVNLGWKLAAVVNGWAPAGLLDSYEAERKPIAAHTIAAAARNMATLAPELSDERLLGPPAQFDAARPAVAQAVQQAKDSEFHSLDLVLGYTYQNSPVVSDRAGARLTHRWLAPGDSLYDHLGPEFTLLGDLADPLVAEFADAARAQDVPLTLFDDPTCALVLVRPDQHLAWTAEDPGSPAEILRRAIGHDN
ncbi:FAD-dependent monooxygenase [Nocardia goodfellowii]|uniref:2-polyprenyl-6-methoxyphenol hydroxylase-like FAD-dependent oxidoreductase n=1 Tax=Nocardia goodfellowii TaxID=882446 RepID=A0ABS4QN50_9NOCA|nr:FAD-dependent monooxygenase [Nocardia goodfellowii]MBP2192459.1 2-polyprenyl-6-methoxyphenol hydroxylase-like FAD-dependent oxidoreductase [Nocardia goodfellowii]